MCLVDVLTSAFNNKTPLFLKMNALQIQNY